MQSEKKGSRNTQIDGLRAIMVLIIVTFHLVYRFQDLFCNVNIRFMKYWGGFGSVVFLIISAYFANGAQLRNVPKKIFRLWPTYFASILITMIVLKILPVEGRMCSWNDFILNVFWVNGYISMPYIDGAHWYITVLISSIIVIAVINKLGNGREYWGYLVWMCIGVLCKILTFNFGLTLIAGMYSGIVCIGSALKKICSSEENNKDTYRWIIIVIIGLFVTGFLLGWVKFFETILAIPIVIAALQGKCKFLDFKLFQKIGLISYPLYLIHQNVSYAIELWLMKVFGTFCYWYVFLAFLVSILFAIIIYYFVERLVQKYLKSVGGK